MHTSQAPDIISCGCDPLVRDLCCAFHMVSSCCTNLGVLRCSRQSQCWASVKGSANTLHSATVHVCRVPPTPTPPSPLPPFYSAAKTGVKESFFFLHWPTKGEPGLVIMCVTDRGRDMRLSRRLGAAWSMGVCETAGGWTSGRLQWVPALKFRKESV